MTDQHVSFAVPPLIFSPYLVSTSLSHLVLFGMLAPLFGIPFHLILDQLKLTLPSNPISKLTFSLLKAFLAPNRPLTISSVRFWFDIVMLILALKTYYHYYYYNYYYYYWLPIPTRNFKWMCYTNASDIALCQVWKKYFQKVFWGSILLLWKYF